MTNIEALEHNAALFRNLIAETERRLETQRNNLKEIEAAIAAARLQTWYAANPGIELRVGDQLAVISKVKLLLNGWKGVVIDRIYMYGYDAEPQVTIRCSHGDDEEVSIDTARRMREAWLAQEAGT